MDDDETDEHARADEMNRPGRLATAQQVEQSLGRCNSGRHRAAGNAERALADRALPVSYDSIEAQPANSSRNSLLPPGRKTVRNADG